MTKNGIIFSIVLFINLWLNQVHCQPKWALNHFESQIGVWSSDNSKYKSNDEPITVYVLQWHWSGLKNNLVGRLYGKIDSINTPAFWDFYQYWNPKTEQIDIKQIGSDGTVGFGSLIFKDSKEYELLQEFTTPKGQSRCEKHKYKKPDSITEISTSFEKTLDGQWNEKRTYFWFKIK